MLVLSYKEMFYVSVSVKKEVFSQPDVLALDEVAEFKAISVQIY